MGKYNNVLSALKKYKKDEQDQAGEYPYYVVKRQKEFFQRKNVVENSLSKCS